jgi:hypothetical protein
MIDLDQYVLCDDDGTGARHHRAIHRSIFIRHVHKRADAHGCVLMLRGHKYCYVGLGGPAGSGAGAEGIAWPDGEADGGGLDGGYGSFGGFGGGSGGSNVIGSWADAGAFVGSIVGQGRGPINYPPPAGSPAPETSTWAMLALGLSAFAWKRWRRA